jgi:Ni/Fe-hydrogenase subunit HybB-like protein
LGFIGIGAYAYYRQFTEGLVVTGLRDIGTMAGSPWGLYISFDIYFVGISFAGITVAAFVRILNIKELKPISRMAELLTVISLILAGLSIIPDLGQPIRGIVNLFKYARPQSPFFGTFTLVIAGYLFASMVYLYLDGRRDAAIMARKNTKLRWFYRLWAAGYKGTPAERDRHSRASLWLAMGIVPILVAAHSTLGFVFGLQAGRPGWLSALQAPGFVILAGVSGLGMLIVIAAIMRKSLGAEERIGEEVFRRLGIFMLVLAIAYLYFMIVEWLTTTYAAHYHELTLSQALLSGEFAPMFWTVVGGLVASVIALTLPFLPVSVRLPAYRPRLAWLTGSAAAAVALVMVYLSLAPQQVAAADTVQPFASWVPWLLIALAGLFFVSFVPRMRESWMVSGVFAGVLANIAAILKRFLIVVPSQTHGTLLPYSIGTYRPTWVEYSIILGLIGLGVLLYAVFAKVFPLMRIHEAAGGGD